MSFVTCTSNEKVAEDLVGALEGNVNILNSSIDDTINDIDDKVTGGELGDTSQINQAAQDIVQTAIAAGSFNTLVQAVQAAGLVETLSGPGPFTVFAPTDEAFAKVPEETLNALLADPDALADVLTYHVVADKVMAEDVVNLDSATTVQGGELTIDTSNGVTVNGAKVVTTDIETSNGVIHVIDAVLLPPTN